ncbi:MAG: transcriptional repressor [Planctomycetaceae bacterium]|nr:transcriptional repressor [Planctomycetaceae bacterium]
MTRQAVMEASAPSDSQLRKTLHAMNLRGTKARVVILRAVFRRGSPVSQAEIASALGEFWVDLSTICRALNDMINVGLLRRVEVGDLVWRYELATDRRTISEHPHFYCHECGRVTCLFDFEETLLALRDELVNVGTVHSLVLRGICDECGRS